MMISALRRLNRDQRGETLVRALILVVITGLITGPLVAFTGNGVFNGQVYTGRTAELYAADAGFEDALWKIEHKDKVEGAWPCNPSSPPLTYTISNVNNRSVEVEISYVEMEGNIYYKVNSTTKDDSDSQTMVESYVQFTPGGELDIFSGALASKSDISLKKDSEVNGDVYHCEDFDYGGSLGGDWTDKGCAPFPAQGENEAFAQAFIDEAKLGGTYNGNMDISSSRNLGPLYINGNLYISADVTITITGVVYVTGTITCKKEFTLAGAGSIVAEGDIYISKVAGFGTTGDSIIMSLNGDITFKKECTVDALIYAPNGAISFDKATTVTGGVVGESIYADKEGSFTFVPKTDWDFPGDLPGSIDVKTYNVDQA